MNEFEAYILTSSNRIKSSPLARNCLFRKMPMRRNGSGEICLNDLGGVRHLTRLDEDVYVIRLHPDNLSYSFLAMEVGKKRIYDVMTTVVRTDVGIWLGSCDEILIDHGVASDASNSTSMIRTDSVPNPTIYDKVGRNFTHKYKKINGSSWSMPSGKKIGDVDEYADLIPVPGVEGAYIHIDRSVVFDLRVDKSLLSMSVDYIGLAMPLFKEMQAISDECKGYIEDVFARFSAMPKGDK